MSGCNKSKRRRVAELGMANPLFELLDGHVEWMHDGRIQPEWVQQRLNVIAVPALAV